MEDNRKKAIADGLKTYVGRVCSSNEEHGDERYASNGGCVVCAAERVAVSRAAKPKKALMNETEVQALLLRGGPNTREVAEAAGLKWYNHPEGFKTEWTPPGIGVCHAIIGLDGFCPLCGKPTPEPVDVKETVDLDASRLLE